MAPVSSSLTIWAIVLAAGSGRRYGSLTNKLLARLGEKPVLMHTLEAICEMPRLSGVVLVGPESMLDVGRLAFAGRNLPLFHTEGGDSRRDSVWYGLQALARQNPDWVLVHDGARPVVSASLQARLLDAAKAYLDGSVVRGIVPGLPPPDTIKRVEEILGTQLVAETLPRDELMAIQTPQLFSYEALCKAHQAVSQSVKVTDDAQLIEHDGGQVMVVAGDPGNLKVTTPDDLALAEWQLSRRSGGRGW